MLSLLKSHLFDYTNETQKDIQKTIDAIPGKATFIGPSQTRIFSISVSTLCLYPKTLFYEYYMNPLKRIDAGYIYINYSEINMDSALLFLEGKYVNLDRKTEEQLQELKDDLLFFRISIPQEIDKQLELLKCQKKSNETHEKMLMQCLSIIQSQMNNIKNDVLHLKSDVSNVERNLQKLDKIAEERMMEMETQVKRNNDIVSMTLLSVKPRFDNLLKDEKEKIEMNYQHLQTTMEMVEMSISKQIQDHHEEAMKRYQILEESLETYRTATTNICEKEEEKVSFEKTNFSNVITKYHNKNESFIESQKNSISYVTEELNLLVNKIQNHMQSLLTVYNTHVNSTNKWIQSSVSALSDSFIHKKIIDETLENTNNQSLTSFNDSIPKNILELLEQQELKLHDILALGMCIHEAMYNQLVCPVIPHPLFSFPCSSLLTDYYAYKVLEWTGMDNQWKLVYSGRFDGYKSKEFHRRCDNKGETILIVKCYSNKIPCIFGGYSQVGWKFTEDKDWTSIYDKNAFLFTLQNPHHIVPSQYKNNQKYDALRYNRNWGPCFNCGICISDDCNSNSYSHIMFDDQDPVYEQHPIYKSSLYIDLEPKQSKSFFKVEDIEVFIKQ
ncbi:hypothetical protein WA158_007346 [Blastocystis sp. Blastoise]